MKKEQDPLYQAWKSAMDAGDAVSAMKAWKEYQAAHEKRLDESAERVQEAAKKIR